MSEKAEFYFSTAQEAEQAFYSAFEACDPELMEAVWAEGAVSCIHPGAPVIHGRQQVLSSWQQIFTGAQPPALKIETISQVAQELLAVHTVIERISADHHIDSPTTEIIATNTLVRQENGWRMLQHHASVNIQIEDNYNATHDAPNALQ